MSDINPNYNSSEDKLREQSDGNSTLLLGSVEKVDGPDTNVAVYFDVINSHSIQVNDGITDNWLENNSVVNDCIAHAPMTITLSGISAELVYKPSMNGRFLQKLYEFTNDKILGRFSSNYVTTDKLTVLSQLYPPVDNITQTAKNIITVVEDNIIRYKKLFDNFISSKDKQTRLQQIYNDLMTLRYMRAALVVVTPYTEEPLQNMYIQSLTLSQDNQGDITDISITLKQVRFSEVSVTAPDENVVAQANAALRAEEENQGKVQGKSSNKTLLKQFFTKLGFYK